MKTGVTLVVTVLLSGLFSFVNFYEFVSIVVFHTAGYPFGEDPVSWHYRTVERFTVYCLVFGILFLIPLILSVWSYRKRRMRTMRAALLLTFLLIAFSYIL